MIKFVRDGVYHVGLDVRIFCGERPYKDFEILWNDDHSDTNNLTIRNFLKSKDFLELAEMPNLYVFFPYETYGVIITDTEPIMIGYKGMGFNYGSCNVVKVEKPGYIIISAAND